MSRTAAFTNRKKIRGWKTQIKRVERWRTRHLKPDREFFRRNGVAYCKLWIDPWHRLTRRQPPIWLGRQMVNSLLDLYEAWASEDVPETEYLKVWLMWPELTESQVVMAGATKAEMYQNSFRPVADLGWAESRGFPPQFGFQLLERLNKYDWQECLHEYTVDRQDVSDAWLKKRPYSNLSSEEGLFSVLVEVGRIWVGTRRVFVNGG